MAGNGEKLLTIVVIPNYRGESSRIGTTMVSTLESMGNTNCIVLPAIPGYAPPRIPDMLGPGGWSTTHCNCKGRNPMFWCVFRIRMSRTVRPRPLAYQKTSDLRLSEIWAHRRTLTMLCSRPVRTHSEHQSVCHPWIRVILKQDSDLANIPFELVTL